MLKKLYLIFLSAFLFGILLGDMWMEGVVLQILVSVVVCGCGIRVLLAGHRDFLRIVVLIFLMVLLGMGRFFWSFEEGERHVRNFEGEMTFRGCVVEEVDVRVDKVKYIIEAEGEMYGRVLVNAARYPVYEYGDCFEISGQLEAPGAIQDFEYDKYLARYGVYRVMYRAQMKKVGEELGVFRLLFAIKGNFEDRLSRIFGEPHASFMAGLILGSRRGIPTDLLEKFNITGLTHIIAISGWNITLIIVLMGYAFSFLGRRVKVVVSSVVIVLFVFLVGASAAVVRAAIMGVISLFALWFGRQYFVEIAIFGAAFLMNLWNPKVLVYDIGFQLSVLATLGLVYFGERITNFRWMRYLPEKFGVKEAVAMTLAAQILALPVILLNFGRLSLVSVIANVFVLPFIPVAMFFGFVAVVVSYLWRGLGIFVGFFGYLVLEIIVFFVELFSKVPLAAIEVSWFNWWMPVVWYGGVFWWLIRSHKS